jgi:hypothetical protein
MGTAMPLQLTPLLWLSVTRPREAAAAILALRLPRPVLWQAGALAVVLSAVMTELMARLPGGGAPNPVFAVLTTPFALALAQAAALWLTAVAMHRIGRAAGGTGDFDGALALVVWLQLVMLAVQLAVLAAVVLLPVLGALASMGSVVLFFWMLTRFVQALHGFRSPGLVLFGIFGAMLGIVVALTLLFGILGIFLPGATP